MSRNRNGASNMKSRIDELRCELNDIASIYSFRHPKVTELMEELDFLIAKSMRLKLEAIRKQERKEEIGNERLRPAR